MLIHHKKEKKILTYKDYQWASNHKIKGKKLIKNPFLLKMLIIIQRKSNFNWFFKIAHILIELLFWKTRLTINQKALHISHLPMKKVYKEPYI